MNKQQYERVHSGSGFIAALDQSGGSTPKALEHYGLPRSAYSSDSEMFDMVHEMRTRIMTSRAFDGNKILAAILFEDTMDRNIEGLATSDYLWEKKQIVPFLKIDKGLAEEHNGVQIMKPIPDLSASLARATNKHIFGTKERSVVHTANKNGIQEVVEQQFELARQVLGSGLIPIIEPEVNIHSPEKSEAEEILKACILKSLTSLSPNQQVLFKLTLPDVEGFYRDLTDHPHVLRVVALSGGYTRQEACARLARNHGVIASFSRALTEGLSVDQSDEQFDKTLDESIARINEASTT